MINVNLVEKYITNVKFTERGNFVLNQFKDVFVFKNIVKVTLIEYKGEDESIIENVHRLNNSIITKRIKDLRDISKYPKLIEYAEIPDYFMSDYLKNGNTVYI